MSSVTTKSFKQTNALYVPIGNCANSVLQFGATTGAGGSFAVPAPTAAAWAANGSAPSKYTSTISTIGAGGYFRDMGKTVVSASRTFRKVQLLVNAVSTSGVGGPAPGTVPVVDYLTGYIEIASGPAFNGNAGTGIAPNANPAPVAVYPSLW